MTAKDWGVWALFGWAVCGLAYIGQDVDTAIPIGIVALFFTFSFIAALVNGKRNA